jgi:hypothetical protein
MFSVLPAAIFQIEKRSTIKYNLFMRRRADRTSLDLNKSLGCFSSTNPQCCHYPNFASLK